ncbi:MAG: non-homologous end-joining DNA ligase [Rudaea sp.]|uniref:non-homologous end-joining DNA ligase n=1 Tax=unclassified Rudaea TaxID=2627037 RepID=UPI0010F6F1F2|nr:MULTISPECIES: non-homologous end-joining DNA ligase [unclassified Rudaea]MBN8884441.1 non-homologous end-joining DNA ligase [Rudaea sp.]
MAARKVKAPPGARAETITDGAFAPELCRSQKEPPRGDDWLHETKWDGYRIVAAVADGNVRLWSRNAIEWTRKVPELAAAVAALKLKSAQLDGEMVVLRDGRDDFNALQSRLSAETKEPAVYVLFDLPHLDGQSLRAVPLVERKRLLKDLIERRPHPLLRYSEHVVGPGAGVFAQATKAGLEGIVSKRVESHYRGDRSGAWVKVKGRPSDEFVVVGFTEPKGSRSGIGALLLAKYLDGQLVYCGRVGTGFKDEELKTLRKRVNTMIVDEPPANITLMERKDRALAIWIKPELVLEAFYQGVGGQGLLRQPAFKAFRLDKKVQDLRRESRKKSA